MRTLSTLTALILLTISSLATAAGEPQCSGEIATPLYHCINLDGAPDIRIYVQEFQTCENGKITELDRTVNAFYFNDDALDPEVEIANTVFANARHTAPERADHLTVVPPTAATLKTEAGVFKLKMTLNQAPNYEGAPVEQYHYVGSFEQTAKNGKIAAAGKLACFLD